MLVRNNKLQSNKKTIHNMHRDCMKGDEMENKKIGGSVNLMVRGFMGFYSGFYKSINQYFQTCKTRFHRSFLFPWSELLQIGGQQRGHVHPLHPQAVWPASPSRGLHRWLTCFYAASFRVCRTTPLTGSYQWQEANKCWKIIGNFAFFLALCRL